MYGPTRPSAAGGNEYWVSIWPRHEQLTGEVTELLLGHLHLIAGERVLDVGSGGGITSLAAARLVGATGSVVGADISVPLVDLAVRRASEQACANVRFLVADAQHATIEGAPFDAAIRGCADRQDPSDPPAS